MGYGKFINLDEESFEIWKKKFGSYSQEFSGWICDKLKEEDMLTMNIGEKRENIDKKKIELKEKLGIVEIEEKKLRKEEDIEEETKEELEQKKLAREKEVKRNFFSYAKDVHNFKDKEIKELFEEFKQQDLGQDLGIIHYLNEKYEEKVEDESEDKTD